MGFSIGDRVMIRTEVPGGTNRTPFFIRGKRGVVVFIHGPAGNPRDLSRGGTGEPKLPLYGVSFHMAHLYDDDPQVVHDRVIVDVWGDWIGPVPEHVPGPALDLEEHELSYYDKRTAAIQSLLVSKGLMNTDESRMQVAELDFRKRGERHPMVEEASESS
jgi:hypothetical protein